MIIAIDGLSATGKSSVAYALANILGYTYFNTGLLYRFVSYIMIKNNITDIDKVIELLNHLNYKFDNNQILVDNKDITSLLYTDKIALYTSHISSNLKIKKWVYQFQKKALLKKNIVIEGRDIISKVARDADYKFYLYADINKRAKRVLLREKNKSFEEALEELKSIDEKNIISKDFIEPKDAIKIDTTNLSVDEIINYMLNIILKK